jgi:hypothetical protein
MQNAASRRAATCILQGGSPARRRAPLPAEGRRASRRYFTMMKTTCDQSERTFFLIEAWRNQYICPSVRPAIVVLQYDVSGALVKLFPSPETCQ